MELSLFVLFGVSSVVAAESNSTLYVNGTSGSDLNNGTSMQHAKATITNAVSTAANNGTIYIAPESTIIINKNMTVIGSSKTSTIINAQGGSIFNIAPEITVTLENGSSWYVESSAIVVL